MELQVETYEATRFTPDGAATEEIQSPEAQALIESLGLDGQKSLLAERQAGADDTVVAVNPYRQMTLTERRIFNAVTPVHTLLGRYAAGPIPLRVLQVAAHAEPFFTKLEVWHPEHASIDDPVLVGYRADPDRTWREQIFILARWGVHLLPLDELQAQAAELLTALWGSKLGREIGALENFRRDLAQQVQAYLGGDLAQNPFAMALPAGPAGDVNLDF